MKGTCTPIQAHLHSSKFIGIRLCWGRTISEPNLKELDTAIYFTQYVRLPLFTAKDKAKIMKISKKQAKSEIIRLRGRIARLAEAKGVAIRDAL